MSCAQGVDWGEEDVESLTALLQSGVLSTVVDLDLSQNRFKAPVVQSLKRGFVGGGGRRSAAAARQRSSSDSFVLPSLRRVALDGNEQVMGAGERAAAKAAARSLAWEREMRFQTRRDQGRTNALFHAAESSEND